MRWKWTQIAIKVALIINVLIVLIITVFAIAQWVKNHIFFTTEYYTNSTIIGIDPSPVEVIIKSRDFTLPPKRWDYFGAQNVSLERILEQQELTKGYNGFVYILEDGLLTYYGEVKNGRKNGIWHFLHLDSKQIFKDGVEDSICYGKCMENEQ